MREAPSAVGIYDRDYYRQEPQPGVSAYTPRTVVAAIIVVNVAIWLIDSLTEGRLSEQMAVHPFTLTRPWLWWEFLTAGFAHSPSDVNHILFNMLGLFFLGRDVEDRYGPKEFSRVYLAMVIFASIVWCVVSRFTGSDTPAYGASGAVTGVVILYILNFPHRTLLLFFVIPVPAWLVGVLLIGMNLFGASGHADPHIAYSMHLAGAALAFVYYQRGWNLSRLTANIRWPKFRRKPRLKIHRPAESPPSDLMQDVDRILEKIYREGESSLTAAERKTLESASREYQRRKMKTD